MKTKTINFPEGKYKTVRECPEVQYYVKKGWSIEKAFYRFGRFTKMNLTYVVLEKKKNFWDRFKWYIIAVVFLIISVIIAVSSPLLHLLMSMALGGNL